ncbi:MAG: AI-2E family transporter [Syntrophotaleaceae bacterium]
MENTSMGSSRILMSLAALVLVAAGLNAAKVILVPVLLAGFIAIISAPPMFWLQRKGFPTWLALLIVILGVFLLGMVVATLIGTSVGDFTRNLPNYETRVREQTGDAVILLQRMGIRVSSAELIRFFDPGAAMKLIGMLLNALGNMVTNGLLVLLTVIFMLLEASSFPAKLRLILGGENSLEKFEYFLHNVQHYVAIKTIISLITGVLVAVLLIALRIDYPFLWGLLAFLLNYVPNIGSIIAAIPAVLLALIQFGLFKAVMVAIGFLTVNLLLGGLIEPRFMGRELGLSTLVVFLSLLLWGWLLGPVGMLLSVPLTMTAKIALDSHEDTRWIGVLMGPEKPLSTKRTAE